MSIYKKIFILLCIITERIDDLAGYIKNDIINFMKKNKNERNEIKCFSTFSDKTRFNLIFTDNQTVSVFACFYFNLLK